MGNENLSGFVLRKAAGMINLLSIDHPDKPYVNPLRINETGAEIWEMLLLGMKEEEIAGEIAKEYEIDIKEAGEDVGAFMDSLKKFGVKV